MSRRGLTLMELLVAVAVLSVTITLALRTLVLTDRVTMRGQARLQTTLDRVALQSQLRRDIWAAERFTTTGPGSATFAMAEGPSVTYSVSAGKTSRTCAGIETLYRGTVAFTRGQNALIHVGGRDAAQWHFSARMRNAPAGGGSS